MLRTSLLLLVCLSLAAAPVSVTGDLQIAINHILPNSLRANLSFLASDTLAGRDTPSPGLDVAAEFIASRFRLAGLEPAGDDGYFQTAKMMLQEPNLLGLEMTVFHGGEGQSVPVEILRPGLTQAVDVVKAPVFKLDLSDAAFLEKLKPEDMAGKVVAAEFTRGAMQRAQGVMPKLLAAKPVLLVQIQRAATGPGASAGPQLVDPEAPAQGMAALQRITIVGPGPAEVFDGMKPGLSDGIAISLHAAAPKQKPLMLRNVVGILRGSDPELSKECVLVSAHYDHIGVKPSGEGDRIFNGANDDGSGTVSVIEIANALAGMGKAPKRSIVFVTFFGEEKGGFGARYYTRHPVMPLASTVADINLEQVGRVDSTEGDQRDRASLTGFDYSDVADTMAEAGKLVGVRVYKHEKNSDAYFDRSDNATLAAAGVPAHTLCVAFNYADYHGVGDEWQKIDYGNMAKVDRMVALSLYMFAESSGVPHWNAGNEKAQRYLKAWQESHKP